MCMLSDAIANPTGLYNTLILFIQVNSPGFGRFGRKKTPNFELFQDLPNPGIFPAKLKKMLFIDPEYLILLFYMKVHPKIPLCAKN